MYPTEIRKYLKKEIDCEAVLGPFQENPCNRPCFFSPLNTRDKKDSKGKRIILDLSFPEGNSVNDGLDKTKYFREDIVLKFPTVDKLAEIMVSKGVGCLMFKRDLKRYYRQSLVDPVDAVKLGYMFEDEMFFDAALPMGLTSSAYIAQRITNAVIFILRNRGIHGVNYIDDIECAASVSEAQQQFESVGTLVQELGIMESTAKTTPPSTKMIFLGIQLDSVKQTMEIDRDRLASIKVEIANWMGKKYTTLKQVQSIVRSLSFCASCIPEGNLIFSRILTFMKSFRGKGFHKIPVGVRKDLSWWNVFAQQFNGVAAIPALNWQQLDSVFSMDACLTGEGGWTNKHFFHFRFLGSIIQQGKYINQFKLYTVMIATRLWAPSLAGMNILIYCDNETNVQVLHTGASDSRVFSA